MGFDYYYYLLVALQVPTGNAWRRTYALVEAVQSLNLHATVPGAHNCVNMIFSTPRDNKFNIALSNNAMSGLPAAADPKFVELLVRRTC